MPTVKSGKGGPGEAAVIIGGRSFSGSIINPRSVGRLVLVCNGNVASKKFAYPWLMKPAEGGMKQSRVNFGSWFSFFRALASIHAILVVINFEPF